VVELLATYSIRIDCKRTLFFYELFRLNDADFASVKNLSLDLEICIIYVVFEDNVNLRITGKLVSRG
jgi:hypothetical protein